MRDYEYYKDEMDNGIIPFIEGQAGMEENLLLGRIITWLPRKIIGLFKGTKRKDNYATH